MAARRRQLAVPELAAVEVHGMTREDFLIRGALAAVATYGAGAMGPFVRRAFAQSGEQDVDVATFVLGLEKLEATYYKEALKKARGLGGEARSVARVIRDSELEHVDIVDGLVRALGGTPPQRAKFRFPNAFSSESRFLALAQTFEDTGVSAYNGAAPVIASTDVLQTAGRIVQIEARHAAVIRSLRGEEIAPSAFDAPLEMDEVTAKVDPYIAEGG
jgi:hypothetical protein